ncbi:nitroreductase family protein [uncultured Cyclobacterium sp.]|uniref:nitroreductase family protein n=1 Tax=uncultured Cyclobacterium sp. TaxID=453820 RepID=UPI0030ED560E|tara:strand:- start:16133 stop:17209 length:1077 start_codon:yes stop_codon:yes gene_type:complete
MIKKILKYPFKKFSKVKNSLYKEKLPLYFHNSTFLSSLYYFLFSPTFRREHRAVLSGKVKHIQEAKKSKYNYFLLVRNTHRIEKGLLMRPRRDFFAADFIGETVDSYLGVIKNQELEKNPQIKWFKDVLTEYFKVCKPHKVIDSERERFLKADTALSGADVLCTQIGSLPYKRDPDSFSGISYEDYYKLSKQRKSVRWFLNKPVDRALIDKAILAAVQAPSACNRQPFEYHIIDDRANLDQVIELPMGTKGYAHSIQTFIVAVGNLDAYFDERDRHLIYIDASLANMSLMLALETLGLGSCPINWPDIELREQRMTEFLNLKAHQRPIMCIGIGYPDPEGKVAFSEKRSLDDIRKYLA